MKVILFILSTIFLWSGCSSSKKMSYNNSPVINAVSTWTEYGVGGDWYSGQWEIAPHVAHDTLKVICYKPKETFIFKTDSDSIRIELKANTWHDFYVRLDEGTYAHTIVEGVPFRTDQLAFDSSPNPDYRIMYQTESSQYLEELKNQFPLEFIENKMSDTDIVLSVLNWTNSRWDHNGNNSPSQNDAITILNEAAAGQQFPCFAYAIVLRDQLTALGYKARTVYLKTKDAEHRRGSPGHVATEVFLKDLKKWVFVDGQFNVMPTLDGIPLNAVEFQDAISNDFERFILKSISTEKPTKSSYVNFVYEYLFYFDTSLDNRYDEENIYEIKGKQSLMLVPKGADNLKRIDFWSMDVDYCIYTSSLNIFYAKPI